MILNYNVPCYIIVFSQVFSVKTVFCSGGLTRTGSGQMMRAAVASVGRRLPGLFPSF